MGAAEQETHILNNFFLHMYLILYLTITKAQDCSLNL